MFERDRDQDRPRGERPSSGRSLAGDGGEPDPEIKRPRGSTWRRLESEGIVWEGQVVLIGEESDLAARLIVTKRRLAFVRGGSIALEVGREWLTPPPLLLPDGTLGLSITLDASPTENLFVQAREGRRVAGHLATLLGGSGARRPRSNGSTRARSREGRQPEWTSSFLPESTPAAAPGPLFPDEVVGADLAGSLPASSGGLPFRAAPSPSSSHEPAWARPRRDRVDVWESGSAHPTDLDGSGKTRREPLDSTERVTALVPDQQSGEPLQRRRFTDAAIEVLSPATAFGSSRPRPRGESSYVVPAPPPPSRVGRHSDWNLQPMRGIAPRDARRRRRQEWLARLLGLLVLAIFTGVAIMAQTGIPLTGDDGGNNRLNASVGPSPAAVAQTRPTATTTATATNAAPAPGSAVLDLPAQTAEAIGVGGPDATETEASKSAPPSTLPPTDSIGGDSTAARDQGSDLNAAGGPDSTAPATSTVSPTATTAPGPTATDEPTAAPTETEAPPPTATATATDEAAIVPVDDDASDGTGGTTGDASGTTAPAPSLAQGEIPNQTFVSGPFRFSIAAAVRSPSVPELELYDYGTGDWVALVVDVVNWSDYPATLGMPEFVLSDASRVAPVTLDTGTSLIARTLGLDAAYVHDAYIPYAPGEQHRILLLYLVTPDSFDLTLRTNEAAVALDDTLTEEFDSADLPAEEPLIPDLTPAFVTAVLDGQTIEVDINGELRQIRYLGVDAPLNTDCWAFESTQANIYLVIGQPVWLERQRTNSDDQGHLLRDVWVIGPDGLFDLVAERLVAQGAAAPAATDPNTRLADWLEGTAVDAAALGWGRWGFCPIADSEIGIKPVLATLLPFVVGMAWVILGTPGLDALTQRRAIIGSQAEERSGKTPDRSD